MISTRGRYAIRVMLDLAEHDQGGYIPLKDIAARQEISKKYLEIIVKDMVAGNLLVGASGKGGGYRLCRKPEEWRGRFPRWPVCWMGRRHARGLPAAGRFRSGRSMTGSRTTFFTASTSAICSPCPPRWRYVLDINGKRL